MFVAVAEQLTPVSWDSLWTIEGLVAMGTILLALGTAFLAWWTSRMATKTARLANLTEKEVNAVLQQVELQTQDVSVSRAAHEGSVRPVLVPVPSTRFLREAVEPLAVPDFSEVRIDVTGIDLNVSVPFRNAGAGIAFLSGGWFRWTDPLFNWAGEMTTTALPPDEIARVSFLIPAQATGGAPYDRLRSYGAFSVSVDYSDLAGNVWSSRLDVNATQHGWEVSGVVITHTGRTDEVGSL